MKPFVYSIITLAALSGWAWGQEPPSAGVPWECPGPLCQAMPHPPEPPCPPDASFPPDQAGPRGPEMEKERRMLEALRVTRMTEALKLTDDQVARFIPRLKQVEERHRQLRRDRARVLKGLGEILDKPERRGELRSKLEELDKLEREQVQGRLETMRSLDSLLTTEQQARWRVFNERFDQEIREMVKEIRKKRMERHHMRQW